MRLSHKLAIGPLLVSLCALSHADTWVEIGDYTQVILPLGGLGLSLAKGDTTGTLQLTKSFATSFTITQSIKWVVDKRRPNFTTNNSFPSGHTTAAFSGASFLHTRYGSAWGSQPIPSPLIQAGAECMETNITGTMYWRVPVLRPSATCFL
ncbi:hypothetical protein [Agarivorans gilvus]|uniref:hypothetical protein n=1 Tax=Agarivorans gilvus TaxID=680279 RepID=UPI0006EC0DD1|nr:hypothetical protein [Agarivorans gilvus]